MIRHLLLTMLLCIAFAAMGNAQMGVGTITPDASAQMDVSSTNKGFLPPRLTQVQRDSIASPAPGLLLFNTTSNRLNFWTGGAWTEVLTDQGSLNADNLTSGFVPPARLDSVPAASIIGTLPTSAETDPKVGTTSSNTVPRWNGTKLVNGTMQDNGTGLGVGGNPPASALLSLTSTSKGMLIPRMTASQRVAIAAPATALLVYQTNGDPGFYYYNGVAWVGLINNKEVGDDGFQAANWTMTTLATMQTNGGLGVDFAGNVYFTSGFNVMKFSALGLLTTFAGSGSSGTINGTGTAASFRAPNTLVVDSLGNVLVADEGSNRKLRIITPAGVVTTNSIPQLPVKTRSLAFSRNLSFPNLLYYLDSTAHTISTYSGPAPTGNYPSGAAFAGMTGLTSPNSSYMYVISTSPTSNAIYAFDLVTNQPTVLLAGGTAAGSADGVAANASFNGMTGIAADMYNNIYVADQNGTMIRRVVPITDYISHSASIVTSVIQTSCRSIAVSRDGTRIYVEDGSSVKMFTKN